MPKPPERTFDTAHLIKIAVCIVAFICAAGFLAVTNKDIQNNYLLLLTPTFATTVPWLIRFGVAIILFVILSGIVSVLVRPIWLALVACVLATVVYAMILGSDPATWISSALIAATLFIFVLYVGIQLKNQINFSAHPLSDMKLLLLSVLIVSTCVSFGLGYIKDSTQHNYLVPPEIKTALVEFAQNLSKDAIDKQPASPEQKKAVLAQIQISITSSVDGAEKTLQQYKAVIPFILGFTLFSALSTVILLLGFLPLLLTRLLFTFLLLTGFAKVTTETREVKHLVI